MVIFTGCSQVETGILPVEKKRGSERASIVYRIDNVDSYDYIIQRPSKHGLWEVYSLKHGKRYLVEVTQLDIALHDPEMGERFPNVLVPVYSEDELDRENSSEFAQLLNFCNTSRLKPYFIDNETLQRIRPKAVPLVDFEPFYKELLSK
jgi:hypothetical protein